jgi:hypothetical protein
VCAEVWRQHMEVPQITFTRKTVAPYGVRRDLRLTMTYRLCQRCQSDDVLDVSEDGWRVARD